MALSAINSESDWLPGCGLVQSVVSKTGVCCWMQSVAIMIGLVLLGAISNYY